jgi:uncharacterized membrane protein YhaH (DUF805 family)
MEDRAGENRISLRLALRPLVHFLRFDGRSTRSEVISFWLLSTVANLGTFSFDPGPSLALMFTAIAALWTIFWSWPWIPLLARRLHDQGRSAKWLSIVAIPAISMAICAALAGNPVRAGFHDLVPDAASLGCLVATDDLAALRVDDHLGGDIRHVSSSRDPRGQFLRTGSSRGIDRDFSRFDGELASR